MKIKLPQRQKAEQLVEWLQEYDQHLVELNGGYPAVVAILGRYVVRASLDHDEAPNLEWWTFARAAKWRDEIAAMRAEDPDIGVSAVGETWP